MSSERPYFGSDYTPKQVESSSRLRPYRRPSPQQRDRGEGDNLIDPRAIPELSLTTDSFQEAIKIGGFGNILGVALAPDQEVVRRIHNDSKSHEGHIEDAAA